MLTDIAPFPDPLPANCRFERADLADGAALLRLAEGCGTILHFGGVSVERPFSEVLMPNVAGIYHIYEAARREKARVIFASSNHAIGFHERSTKLDADCQMLPDGYYGLSKAYGELMGRMYWYKHGVENVNVRIGSSLPEPNNERMLSTISAGSAKAPPWPRAPRAALSGGRRTTGAASGARTLARPSAGSRSTPPTNSQRNWSAWSAAIRSSSATKAAALRSSTAPGRTCPSRCSAEHQPASSAFRWSAMRMASAMMVKVGSAYPAAGKTEPPAT